ncbi:MAG: histidinol-phosphate transaminase [Planctomycetaceae bacterium]|nr:histidinol-phosphate transaminase [Planctomycetaceae bacterium]
MSAVRPSVARLHPYVPGEQPQETGWTKLNTNENPYPCSPAVTEAIMAATGRLHIYPDPLGTPFRKAAAEVLGVEPDCILPANGSDENLTLLLRTFVDPGDLVAYPYPSYILYETLAEIQGAEHARLPLKSDWSWDLEAAAPIVARSKLVLVPNPNSPSGNLWADETLFHLIPPNGILVIDEAYRDFADQPRNLGKLLERPEARRIVITRTVSKSYSLAGLRLGFAVARSELIAEMRKVKDSYNCDALSLAGGAAALRDQTGMQANCDRIRATRRRLDHRLVELGFTTIPSQTNFIWATHPTGQHRRIYEELKARKILVRLMKFPGAFGSAEAAPFDGLRITIGTDTQIDHFLEHLEPIVQSLT